MNIPITQQPNSCNVLLIGDSCIDEYKIGTIDRLSPEAPVPVFKLVETQVVPGMADNVNINFKNLGIDPYFVHNKEDIIKTRFIDRRSGQHIMRLDVEPKITHWNRQLEKSYDNFDAIVISDYNKGFLTYEDIEYIIKNAQCPVFIDTKKTQLADISAPHVYFKINDLEYKSARSLPSNLIVTRGENGATLMQPGLTAIYETKKVEVTDVCGAGDTFLAALVAQYLFTKDIEKAIIFANVAAGITVQHRGNYAPSYDEIRHAGY